MAHHALAQTALLACLSLPLAGYTADEVDPCIDESEPAAYNVAHCGNDADAPRALELTRIPHKPPRPPLPAIHPKKPGGNHGLPIDIATLKAARSALQRADQASARLRQQKLATLDQHGPRWFNF